MHINAVQIALFYYAAFFYLQSGGNLDFTYLINLKQETFFIKI